MSQNLREASPDLVVVLCSHLSGESIFMHHLLSSSISKFLVLSSDVGADKNWLTILAANVMSGLVLVR